MKNTLFTSDWHLFHEKSIEYDKRPFKNLDHMHRVLVNNYNACANTETIGYFLGDMGLPKPELMKPIIDQLLGTKILILGNHDGKPSKMLRCGFDAVLYNAGIVVCHKMVTMTHCPLYGVYREDTSKMKYGKAEDNWHGESNPKRKFFTLPDEGQFHLHGHIHSPNDGKSQPELGRQKDVGGPSNNYRPYSYGQIESFVAKVLKNEKS